MRTPIPALRSVMLWLAAWLVAAPLFAATWQRTPDFQIQTWDRDDGLPDNAVERLLQTRDGWLWVGTRDGLARFDGLRFTVYDGRTPGFTSDAVVDLAEDAEGSLWIATKRGLYRKRGTEFTKFTVEEGLAHNQVNQITPDPGGGLWLATQGGVSHQGVGGIRSFPFTETIMPTIAEPQVVRNIFSLIPAGGGQFWAGGRGGLRRFDPTTGEYGFIWRPDAPLDDLHGGDVQRILTARDGRLWLGGEYALFQKEGDGWKTFPWPLDGGDLRCRQLIEDETGAIWAARGGKLFRARGGILEIHPATALLNSHITDVLHDSRGAVWLGTRHNGLRRLSPSVVELLTTADGLPNNSVSSVCAAAHGGVWVGTQLGVARWREGKFETPAAEIPFQTISAEAIYEERSGDLWVARSGEADPQITWWEPTAGGFRRLGLESGISISSFITEDSQNRLWLGGQRGVACLLTNYIERVFPQGGQLGVHVHRKRSSRWELLSAETRHFAGTHLDRFAAGRWTPSPGSKADWVPVAEAPPERLASSPFPLDLRLPHPDVRAWAEAEDGAIWLGTWGGGLVRLRDGMATFHDVGSGLADNKVHCLLKDAGGVLWAGTAGGLSRHDDATGRWTSATRANGLPGEDIRLLIQDREGNLWFGCEAGIGRIRREEMDSMRPGGSPSLKPLLLDSMDGLTAGQTTSGQQSGVCATPDGRLWFATPQGLAVVDPSRPMPKREAARVFVESLRADGWSREYVGLGRVAPQGPDLLPAGSGRALSLEFTALDYAAPTRLQFRYRLLGHQEEWVEAGTRRVAFYTNLKPGQYRFEAQARGRFEDWGATAASASFVIAPHFWQTGWFHFGWGTLAAAGLLLVVRLRIRRLGRLAKAESFAALAREREGIARDLHDDLGSRLTQISLLGDLATRDPSQAARVATLARETAQNLDNLVWTVHPERDSLRHLASYLRQVAHEFIAPTGIQLELAFAADIPEAPLSASLRKAVLLAVKEALCNVVRHAAASRVQLAFEVGSDAFTVTIEDDGVGMDPKNGAGGGFLERGHGLENMRRRLAEVGGRCAVEPAPGGGVRVTLRAPTPTHPA